MPVSDGSPELAASEPPPLAKTGDKVSPEFSYVEQTTSADVTEVAGPLDTANSFRSTISWLSAWNWFKSSEQGQVNRPTSNESQAQVTINEQLNIPADPCKVASIPAALGSYNAQTLTDEGLNSTAQAAIQTFFSQASTLGTAAAGTAQALIANSLITGIRMVSSERDRDEIIRWFINARDILNDGTSTSQKATELYRSVNSMRTVQLLLNTVGTSASNFYGASLPLALKLAIPVSLVGASVFGMQGAGLVAFGSGIGLPVVLLLFLGVAGVTTVVEAFIKDRNVRDPLTKLLLMFVAFESTRRAKKELLDAMRADAMVPAKSNVPTAVDEVLDFLLKMDPIAFERHVMSFFELDGHPTGMTPRSNDFGVDGYVLHPDGVIVVQCKRYSADNPVGRPAIQQFKGVIEEQRAFKGYFVTTSRFTGEAVESAAQSSRIVLINGEEIVRWHKEGQKLS